MLTHLSALLHFLTAGVLWLIVLVCLLRLCRRIETTAALRLLAPALIVLALVGTFDLVHLAETGRATVARQGWSRVSIRPPHEADTPLWLAWARFAARLAAIAFYFPAPRRSLWVVALIGTTAFAAAHFPELRQLLSF